MNRTKKPQREPNVAAWKGHNDSCLIIVIVSLGIYNYMNIEVHPSLPAYLSLRTSSPRFSLSPIYSVPRGEHKKEGVGHSRFSEV